MCTTLLQWLRVPKAVAPRAEVVPESQETSPLPQVKRFIFIAEVWVPRAQIQEVGTVVAPAMPLGGILATVPTVAGVLQTYVSTDKP